MRALGSTAQLLWPPARQARKQNRLRARETKDTLHRFCPNQQASTLCRATHDSSDFEAYVLDLQHRIRTQAEEVEAGQCGTGETFREDRWDRDSSDQNAGYGITAVLEGGSILEKAAANVSIVRGVLSAERAAAMSSRGREEIDSNGGQAYSATAMSLVFHTATPWIPTLRADVRMFEVDGFSWMGGGCDLTPSYLTMQPAEAPTDSCSLRDDIASFHHHWSDVCGRYKADLYQEYKDWCDRYFYIPCRNEHRGTGGIFFDDLAARTSDFDTVAFTKDVGDNILPSWLPIAEKRAGAPYTPQQRDWQELRRGRYVEFNLLYDRGVKFGMAGGRIESIMVSAPPRVQWQYLQSTRPSPDSAEAEMLDALRQPVDWTRHFNTAQEA